MGPLPALQRARSNPLATAYGLGAYAFGETLANALTNVGVILGIEAAAAVVAALAVAHRYERRWEDIAERALPGPLDGTRSCAEPTNSGK